MADKIQAESAKVRFERYEKARADQMLWTEILEDAYRYAIPNRQDFNSLPNQVVTPGEQKTQYLFDHTAVESVQAFANNIQSIITPPFRNWATFTPAGHLSDQQERQIRAQLQDAAKEFFRILNDTNFNFVINEVYQDLAIGTGIIMINETSDINRPFQFKSVPINSVVFDTGRGGRLENFWRRWDITVRHAIDTWPELKDVPTIQRRMAKEPDTKIALIEGVVVYPDNPKGKQIYYYVQMIEGQQDLITKWLDFNPFIAMRYSVTPGEVRGRGPILTVLPTIRSVNKTREFVLRNLKFAASPVIMANQDAVANAWNLVLEPGNIIPVGTSANGRPPLEPINLPSAIQNVLEDIQMMQEQIKEALFADPLGPPAGPNKSATEISTRQQNWLRKSGSATGRITHEGPAQIVETCLFIMQKKGLVDPVVVDRQKLKIEYQSPVLQIQAEDELAAATNWIQILQQAAGERALAAIKLDAFPGWAADKLNVDQNIVKNDAEMRRTFSDIQSAVTQQQQPAQGGAPEQQPQLPPLSPTESPESPSPFADLLVPGGS